MIRVIIIVFLVLASFTSFCIAAEGDGYFVCFRDKRTSFNPYSYFDIKAIERRLKNNLSLSDSSDFPVNPYYVLETGRLVTETGYESRWFNGVFVVATREQIESLRQLPFVKSIISSEKSASVLANNGAGVFKKDLSQRDSALLLFQTKRMGGPVFRQKNIDGRGIRIAVFDAGFPGVPKNPVFSHLIKEGKIKATYDFVKRDSNVYDFNSHGSMVLSCIAGRLDTTPMGMATGAEFILARTEIAYREPGNEEQNWLAAAEWADKMGVDIINSSLGYGAERYFFKDMDGRISLVARAANMAASKGILVVNAAGNEGSKDWKFLITPADADSVLTVGGIDPYKDFHIEFSSFGPNHSGKLKPNVSSLGMVIASEPKGLSRVEGTSFSAPLTVGFAACAWQLMPHLKNMELLKEIEKSGHLYPYFDYAHGFGIPQAKHFVERDTITRQPTFSFVKDYDYIHVLVNKQFVRNKNNKLQPGKNLFYKITTNTGDIISYFVVLAEKEEVLTLRREDFGNENILVVHFEGYTEEIAIND